MKLNIRRRIIAIAISAILLGAVALWISTAPGHRFAVIRVVDAKGRPIQGAVIQAEGMRTKKGPYRSGWYGWNSERHGVTNAPVTSDAEGFVQLPYPKYVFERIETGALCLSADHPDYVPDRPEVDVATALPAGAPLRTRLDDLITRIRLRAIFTRPPPITLQRGATVIIGTRGSSPAPGAQLFAQISVEGSHQPDFWTLREPHVLMSSRVPTGTHTLRAILLSTNAPAQFSDVVSINAAEGQTNQLALDLKPGVAVRGQLGREVPRPVRNGRVVANIWPSGTNPQDDPPTWHAWSPIGEDGSFIIQSLPAGDLEIVALCDGYVSTNGPGQFQCRYPQKHSLGTNDLKIEVGMEPTARLEVVVLDDKGQPAKGVEVVTWPNVRYGEWGATLLMGDCHNISEWFLGQRKSKGFSRETPADFRGVSDGSGLAILPNLPATETTLAVSHAAFDLPVIETASGTKHRQASFALTPGQTNRITIKLEPKEKAAIAHY